MALAVLQNSFLGGEIAPSLYGRIDDKLVSVGAAELTNFLIQPSGAIKKRSGFKFIKDLGSARFRLIPFRFASDQTLVLAFGDKKIYFITQGQFVMDGSQPYTISCPYTEAEIWDLSYSQNADVVTLTSASHAPMELRRYGATDWRIVEISTLPKLDPPDKVEASATYPASTSDTVADDDLKIQSEQRDIITAQYVVTAVDGDGVESEASGAAITKCNYFITGATVELSWTGVPGAVTYRVYRMVSGVYGFLAQTNQCSLSDTGTTPDTSQTPPYHREAFIGAPSTGEIISISVIDGGSGYSDADIVSGTSVAFAFIPPARLRLKYGGGWAFETYYRLVLISPDGARYSTDVPLSWKDYGSSGESNFFDVWPTDWNGSSCPVKFSQELPPITAEWRVKLEPFTEQGWEGDVWFKNAYGWKEFNGIENRFPDGQTPSEIPATAKTLWETATSSVMARFAPMWESEDGLSCKTAISSLAGNSITLDLEISGGSGARAQAIAVNGVITSVRLLSGGRGYTENSTVKVVSKQGSGAKFKLVVSQATPSEYPRCSGQFDQRRVFAGSNKNPLKIWMTNPSNQSLMMTHTPIQSDDRIEVVAVAEDADIIRHIIGMESLVMLTGSGEMRVMAVNGGALTPMTVGVRAQSYIGANEVKPVIVGSNIVYIAARGGHPRQVIYSDSSASYTSSDLGVRCPHMFDNKNIVDMTITKAPVSMVWTVSSDGMMYVSTFLPDQNINAWQRIDVGGKVESVCAVAEGIEDHVYITVRRNGRCCLERMADIIISDDSMARMMDSFLDATFSQPAEQIAGLDHLEGQEVYVHVDGEFRGTATVEHGIIKIRPAGKNICIGLPFTTRLITIPLEYSSTATFMGVRNVNSLTLRVTGSGGIWYGVYPLHLNETMYQAKRNTTAQGEQNPNSKVLSVSVRGVWDRQSQLMIENRDSLPLEINAISADCDTNIATRR